MGASTSVGLTRKSVAQTENPCSQNDELPQSPHGARDLSTLTLDEVTSYVEALDSAGTVSSGLGSDDAEAGLQNGGDNRIRWAKVAEALRSGHVDGERLAMHRSYDVDGLDGLLASYIEDERARRMLADEVERRFYERPKLVEQKSATKLRAMLAGSAAITRCAGLEAIESQVVGSDVAAEAARRRRLRVREEAKAALAKFEMLSPEERASSRYQGALEFYSDENLDKREALRSEPAVTKLLEKWWLAATAFFGRDAALTETDYRAFHRRLANVVQQATSETFADYDKVLESDLRRDTTDAENNVDRDAFSASVFQVVDQWTATVELSEYVEFLQRGYDAVFGDLEDQDKPAIPDELEAAILHLELVGADGYARDGDLETDRVGDWLDAPDLLDLMALEIYDASSVICPDRDELDNHVHFYEPLDDDNEAPARRRSSSRRRDSQDGGGRRSRSSMSSKSELDRRSADDSPRADTSTRTDVNLKSDETRQPTLSPSKAATLQKEEEEQPVDKVDGRVHIADIAEAVSGKVVIIQDDARPHVLAKQIEKLESFGAKGVLVARSSEQQQPTRLRPHNRKAGIPVFAVSAEDARAAATLGRIRAKKVKLAHFKRSVKAMPPPGCVEVIADLFLAKLADDDRKIQLQQPRAPLRDFVKQYFRNKYGNSRIFQRKYRSFLFGILTELDSKTASTDDDTHAFVVTFAQLCGIGTKSGRVAALEPAAAHFVLDHLRVFEPILLDTSKLIPSGSRTAIQKKLTSAKAARVVGAMLKTKVRAVVHRAFTKHLKLSRRDEVYKVAMAALRALVTRVKTRDDGHLDVLPCPAVLSLLAVTYSACDCPAFDAVDAPSLGFPVPASVSTAAKDSQATCAPKKVATPFR